MSKDNQLKNNTPSRHKSSYALDRIKELVRSIKIHRAENKRRVEVVIVLRDSLLALEDDKQKATEQSVKDQIDIEMKKIGSDINKKLDEIEVTSDKIEIMEDELSLLRNQYGQGNEQAETNTQKARGPSMPWAGSKTSPDRDVPRTAPTTKMDPLDRNIFDRPVSRPETASLMPLQSPVIGSGADSSTPLTNAGDVVEPVPGMASAQLYYDQLTSALAPPVDIGTGTEPADVAPWPELEIDQPDADGDDFAYPIVLDLGGDGIQFIPLGQSRAKFDRDGDRLISHRDEIAFKDYIANAKIDLEGLAWFDQFAQGGNEDGVLDARDELWSKFGVWRDADQDGETDPGELRMTGDGGLSSVNLQSYNVRRDGGPDAQIYGRGQFVIRDTEGNALSGDFYDTALRYLEDAYEPPQPKRMERVRKDGAPLSRGEIMYPAHGNDDDYYMVEAEPLPEDPAKTLDNALYSAKKPEAKRVRLGRKDGQPISRPENLYPDGYPDADYVVVEIPPGKSRR